MKTIIFSMKFSMDLGRLVVTEDSSLCMQIYVYKNFKHAHLYNTCMHTRTCACVCVYVILYLILADRPPLLC